MAIADEIRAAVGTVFGLGPLARDLPREARVGGLVFHPLVGAAIGGIAAAAAALTAPLGTLPAAVAAVAVLAGASGGATLRDLLGCRRATAQGAPPLPAGLALAAVVVLGKLWAVCRLPASGRTIALVLAAMLGRWAVVVQCHGGRPVAGRRPGDDLVGRARLREFGWASTIAFGTTLAALDAVGLVVLLAATLTTVGVRVAAYRRAGGLDAPLLGVSLELVEAAVLVVLAALARG